MESFAWYEMLKILNIIELPSIVDTYIENITVYLLIIIYIFFSKVCILKYLGQ